MKRIFTILSIVVLLFMQSIPTVNAVSTGKSFNIEVDSEATQEQAEIVLTSLSSTSFDYVIVRLPDESIYNNQMTEELKQDKVEIEYDDNSHSLTIKWSEGAKQQAKFIMNDLINVSNKLIVEAFIENKLQTSEEHVFQVAEVEEETKTEKTEAKKETKTEEKEEIHQENVKKPEATHESEKQTDEKTQVDKKEVSKDEKNKNLVEQSETQKSKNKHYEATEIKENIITDFELTLRDGSPLPELLPNPNENEIELKAKYSFELPENHEYGAGSTYTFQLPDQLTVYNQITGDLGEVGTYVVSTDGTVVITFNENIEGNSNIEAWLEVYTIIEKNLEGSTDQTIKVPVRDDEIKEIDINFEPKKGNSIDKRGTPNQQYNATTIEWEIDFNKYKSELKNVQLHDPIGENQEFVLGSIKIFPLEVQLDGSVVKGEEIKNHNFGTEFPLNFGDIDRDAYRVVFETKITDEEETTYPNDAKLTWDDGELSANATVAISRGNALEKRAAHYDSHTQTITWEVKYNYNEKNISQENAFLLDELSENQELINDSFEVVEVEIDSETGEIIDEKPFDKYTVTNRDDGKNGFKLQFSQDIEKAYKIVYQTKANERVYEGANVENKVEANGKTESGNQWVHQEVFHKYHYTDSTDYNEKTTKWGIEINADSHIMNNVVLTDKLPKGLTLDSYRVLYRDQPGNNYRELEAGTHFESTYNKENGELKVDFSKGTEPLNPIEEMIYIEYTTKFDYNLIEDGKTFFKNDAKVTWIAEGEDTPREMEASDTFTPNQETNLNGSKGGTYNAKTKEITWTIGVNYNNRHIEEAIVEDIIQGNQNLDIDSIEVYNMNINQNGSWSKGDPYNDYTVKEIKVDEQQGFHVNLGKINSPYVIEFKTNLEGELIVKEYNNEAVLKDGDKEFPFTAKISVTNGGNYTDKDATQNADNEQVLNWKVNINKTQSTLSNAKLTDKPSANQVILKDSFKLYGTNVTQDGKVSKNTDDVLVKGKDYTLEFKEDEDGNDYFELAFLEEINRPYILEYDTFLMASHNEKVTNNATVTGEQITTEETNTQKEHVVKYSGGDGGSGIPKNGKLEITKIDAVSNETLEGVEFTLFDQTETIALYTATTDKDGKITFDKLRFGDYILKETKVPAGYVSDYADGVVVTIDKEVKETGDKGNTITVENYPIIYEVELTKVDAENSNKTLSDATFKLQQKVAGEFKTIKEDITTDNNGVIHVKELEPGDYQFVETKAPEGYLLNSEPIPFTIEEQALEVAKVTAKNNAVDTTSVEGIKTWKDGDSKDRPDMIKVDLLQNDKVIDTVEVTAENTWKYSYKDLPKTDSYGEEYKYTVKEQAVEGYESTVDGYHITNLRVGKTDVSGTKTWKDDNSKHRPESITVNLLQNGEVIDTQEVTAKNNWTYSFTDLEEFDNNGIEYKYTVEEEKVDGYETLVDGFDITNLRVGTTSINGEKIWKDDNSKDRPETIKVDLLQNGKVIDTQEVTAENNWAYSFIDLAEFDENGVAYEYTVKEQSVDGYESIVDGANIINVRVGTTEISGTKTWKDDDSKDRPDAIKVNLLQNGVVVDTQEVSEETDWTYRFTGLEKYDGEGEAYVYTIKEQGVAGYKSEVDGFDITNTRSEKTSVEVTKGWLDDESENRPESITVSLLQNGEVIETVEITKDMDWKYKFTGLEAYDNNGVPYEYTIKEEPVEGYETTIDGYDITNVRVGKTEVSGTKTWKDDDSKDRPKSITVKLLQNGEEIDSKEVTEADDWTYSFTDLEKYDENGVAYNYTIEEQAVEGYKSTVEGYDITNARAGKTDVSGTKTWKDDDSKDRPKSITVKLLQNGEEIASQKVTAEDNWEYRFSDLDEFDKNGIAYEYTIEEQAVEGYKSTVEGYDITNVRVGKTEVSGTKTWKGDHSNNRPESITVNLIANGEQVDSLEVTENMDWKYSFTDLPAYDNKGKEIVYSVEEVEVPGYETKVDGFDLINTLIPGEPSKPVESDKLEEPEISNEQAKSDELETSREKAKSDKLDEIVELDKPGKGLPKTATNFFNLILIGILFVGFGVLSYIIYRRRHV